MTNSRRGIFGDRQHGTRNGKGRWLNNITTMITDGMCCASYSADRMDEPQETMWDPLGCCGGGTKRKQQNNNSRYKPERMLPLHVLSTNTSEEKNTVRSKSIVGGIIKRYYDEGNPCLSSKRVSLSTLSRDDDDEDDFLRPDDDVHWEADSSITEKRSNINGHRQKFKKGGNHRSDTTFTYPNFSEGYCR